VKVLGASHFLLPDLEISANILIRYALACDIDLAIVGCATPTEVNSLADAGRATEPIAEEEKRKLLDMFRPIAAQIAYYRGKL
jgi:hypothetical protein